MKFLSKILLIYMVLGEKSIKEEEGKEKDIKEEDDESMDGKDDVDTSKMTSKNQKHKQTIHPKKKASKNKSSKYT